MQLIIDPIFASPHLRSRRARGLRKGAGHHIPTRTGPQDPADTSCRESWDIGGSAKRASGDRKYERGAGRPPELGCKDRPPPVRRRECQVNLSSSSRAAVGAAGVQWSPRWRMRRTDPSRTINKKDQQDGNRLGKERDACEDAGGGAGSQPALRRWGAGTRSFTHGGVPERSPSNLRIPARDDRRAAAAWTNPTPASASFRFAHSSLMPFASGTRMAPVSRRASPTDALCLLPGRVSASPARAQQGFRAREEGAQAGPLGDVMTSPPRALLVGSAARGARRGARWRRDPRGRRSARPGPPRSVARAG